MPELPEVETVRRGLTPVLMGRELVSVEVHDARLVAPRLPASIERALCGRTVTGVERRGKYLLITLDGDLVALHHLRMTGSFLVVDEPGDERHVRLDYVIDGAWIRYRDPRRFGTLVVADRATIDRTLDTKLGPEPLDSDAFGAAVLARSLAGRTAPVKAVLLDQRIVAGLGNIYVDEACHLAGVRPAARACDVTAPAVARLVEAIRARLVEAVAVGGSTLRDHRGVDGTAGTMQERFVAYGRAGLPCLRCGATMRGGRVAGRSTTWCQQCQPLPRRRHRRP